MLSRHLSLSRLGSTRCSIEKAKCILVASIARSRDSAPLVSRSPACGIAARSTKLSAFTRAITHNATGCGRALRSGNIFLHGSRQLIGFVSANSPASSTGSSTRRRGTGDCAACKLAQYRLPRTEYEHIIITSGLSYAAAGHERWIGVCFLFSVFG